VLIYAGILTAVVGATITALSLRVPLKVDVIRDRGAIVREVEDGQLENVYRLQVMNTTEAARRYRLSVDGGAGIRIASDTVIEMAPASTRAFPVRIRMPAEAAAGGSQPIHITVADDSGSGIRVTERAVFLSPRK